MCKVCRTQICARFAVMLWRLQLELRQHLALPEQLDGLAGMLCARFAGLRCVKGLQ